MLASDAWRLPFNAGGLKALCMHLHQVANLGNRITHTTTIITGGDVHWYLQYAASVCSCSTALLVIIACLQPSLGRGWRAVSSGSSGYRFCPGAEGPCCGAGCRALRLQLRHQGALLLQRSLARLPLLARRCALLALQDPGRVQGKGISTI